MAKIILVEHNAKYITALNVHGYRLSSTRKDNTTIWKHPGENDTAELHLYPDNSFIHWAGPDKNEKMASGHTYSTLVSHLKGMTKIRSRSNETTR